MDKWTQMAYKDGHHCTLMPGRHAILCLCKKSQRSTFPPHEDESIKDWASYRRILEDFRFGRSNSQLSSCSRSIFPFVLRFALYFCRWDLMWNIVSPSTFMSRRMPFGVALSAFFNCLTAWINLECSSGVHLSLALCWVESDGELCFALADSGE